MRPSSLSPLHSKALQFNGTLGSGKIVRFSLLNGQKSSLCLPMDSREYIHCRKKVQVIQTSTGKPQKLRSPRPSPSFLLSPTSSSQSSLLLSPAHSPHPYLPVRSSLQASVSPSEASAKPSLYAITKYMRTRSPRGLVGGRKRSGREAERTGLGKEHRNCIIEAFLRRFEKKSRYR